MIKRPAVLAVTLLTLSGLAMVPGAPPSAAAAEPSPAVPTAFRAAAPVEVTLITGDRVSVGTASGQRVVTVTDPQGAPTGFRMHEDGGKLFVVPDDAAPLIAEGRLDERLFDVAGLIAEGYDDARTTSIPFIATYPTRAAASGAPVPDGARLSQRLPRLKMAAMRTPKSAADSVWQELTSKKARSAAPSKIWLDAKVRATVTESVEQVRAPEAWDAGFTGDGVKVAVLDTGIDANHPDLSQRIVATKDFTGSSSGSADRHGHGTHAASSVVGDGSASGGVNRAGVAPDASLLIGKVLGDTGGGPTSGVLAGMQWAVDSGADIVSMSLGALVPVCADPLADAVDQLSASSDALFVIAAGNDGPSAGTVGSPGCAPSALTVAADDSALKIAPFSSRGPVEGRDGSYLKPDMAAPGVGIIGARAAGTSLGRPIDDHYTSLSGTSMATPHVAGAAAVLAERSPELTGEQLKARLMSTVRPDAQNAPLAEGTGFLDVHQAVSSTISGPGYIDGEELTWPHDPAKVIEREVTWSNSGDTPVTLNLRTETYDASGAPAPAAMATVTQPTVTVPAHGTATVGLRLSVVEPLPSGGYGEITGRITATSADGAQHAVTTYGFFAQPNTVTVTFRGTTRGDAPAGSLSYVNLISTDRGESTRVYFRDGTAKATIPAGKYDLDAGIYGFDKGVTDRSLYRMVRSLGVLYRPGLALEENTVIDLDAREAHPVEVSASQPIESHTSSVRYQRTARGTMFSSTVVTAANVVDLAISDVPSGQWQDDTRVDLVTRAYAPLLSVSTSAGTRLEPLYAKYSPVTTDGVAYLPDSGEAEVVDAGSGTPEELAAVDVEGRFVLVNLGSDDSQSTTKLQQVTTDALARDAVGVVVAHEFAGRWNSFAKDDVPVLAITTDEYRALRDEVAAGSTQLRWSGKPASPYVYNLHVPFTDGIPADQHHELKEDSLAQVEETWSSQLRDLQYGDGLALALERGSQAAAAAVVQPVLTPTERTAYYSTGEAGWVHWGTSNMAAGGDTMAGGVAYYESARRDTEQWYRGPIRPQAATNLATGELAPLVQRNGDVLETVIPTTGDDAGHVAFSAMTDQYAATLTRDGEPLGRSTNPISAWSVPAGSGRYELTADQRRRTDLPIFRTWSLSPHLTTKWSFDSASTAKRTALPLLVPSYDLTLDPYNRAQPAASYRVELSAPAQPGYDGRATGMTAQVSYDDGATWRDVETERAGDSWVAKVDNRPARGGFVSLRVTATSSDDSTVEQTLVRAYAVR
ncbi:S8 family serine peptidase [Nocardioides albus]|uniref:Subtilisin family serine protease n=1 Tax=Nocardioides albus TaxID=1841 RepID=A0A7W5A3F4_9ACTN|nr:S8 family serine peptidase [Nocardioides albus]MBB3088791.1 subtilisin family serine protease [Nocardioides albus]GGU18660.1 peptidase [Nocardioides albus]